MDLGVFQSMLRLAGWPEPVDKDRMFPRRRTDQVYSTLQQVQRRITEQSGTTAEPGGAIKALPPNAIPHNRPPLSFNLPTMVPAPAVMQAPAVMPAPAALSAPPAAQDGFADQQQFGDDPQPQTAPLPVSALRPAPLAPAAPSSVPVNPNLYPPASGSRRYVIQVSSEMAMLIVLIGLCSMVACYVLGRYHGGVGAGAGLASGPAGSRETVAEAPAAAPSYILVLQSEVATADAVNRYRLGAKQLNDWAQGVGSRSGLKPWFGLREPANGNIELVYGMVNGRLGLPEKDAKAHAFLTKPRHENGGGYGQAAWMVVR